MWMIDSIWPRIVAPPLPRLADEPLVAQGQRHQVRADLPRPDDVRQPVRPRVLAALAVVPRVVGVVVEQLGVEGPAGLDGVDDVAAEHVPDCLALLGGQLAVQHVVGEDLELQRPAQRMRRPQQRQQLGLLPLAGSPVAHHGIPEQVPHLAAVALGALEHLLVGLLRPRLGLNPPAHGRQVPLGPEEERMLDLHGLGRAGHTAKRPGRRGHRHNAKCGTHGTSPFVALIGLQGGPRGGAL
jgi:hypothetical protein